MSLSHEEAVKSAFSVCSHSFNLLIYSISKVFDVPSHHSN